VRIGLTIRSYISACTPSRCRGPLLHLLSLVVCGSSRRDLNSLVDLLVGRFNLARGRQDYLVERSALSSSRSEGGGLLISWQCRMRVWRCFFFDTNDATTNGMSRRA
jgi:hypothetical protein